MRALKVLVVVMGVMIVAGVAVLAATMAVRVKSGGSRASGFSAAPIDIPAGARIETMAAGPDRLILDLVLTDGRRELVFIDLATGRKLGTVPLRTAP